MLYVKNVSAKYTDPIFEKASDSIGIAREDFEKRASGKIDAADGDEIDESTALPILN